MGAVTRPATLDDVVAKFGGLSVAELLRTVTAAEARADFDKLAAAAPALGMHRHGMKANQHLVAEQMYRAYRLLPHNGVRRPTLYAAWDTPSMRDKVLRSVVRLFAARGVDRITKVHVLTAYRLQHGFVGLFRPMVAKYLYCRYSRRGRVLDFCAGWGGRLLAALATPSVVSYVGVDSNVDLCPVYDAIVQRFGDRGGTTTKMLCCAAEDVDYGAVGPFDCVVTSPPYYGVEVYPNQPTYASHEDWLARFLVPTLRGVARHIDPDGAICINIRQPETEQRMVQELGSMGWHVQETLLMPLPAMPGKGSHMATPNYGEPIYVFTRSSAESGSGSGSGAGTGAGSS